MVSTRRNAAASDVEQPAQSSQERRVHQPATSRDVSAEPRPKRGRKKAANALPQSEAATEPSSASASTATASTKAPTTGTKRRLRSTKEADSPLRALPQQTERSTQKRRRVTEKSASATPEPEARSQQQEDAENAESRGPYFTDQKFAKYRLKNPAPVEETDREANGVNGNAAAVALLRKVETAAQINAHVYTPLRIDDENFEEAEPIEAESSITEPFAAETSSQALTEPTVPATPAASSYGPGSFFSRTLSSTFSAFKSPFVFFSTPSPSRAPASRTPASRAPASPTPESPTPKPKASPEPGSLTELLTLTPTPVGERTKTMKKKRRNPMLKALTKGIKPADMAKAEAWAKQVVAQMKNDPQMGEKRKRLEAPVLLKDLKTLPSHKPWESGFGDPLDEYDDDDIVPAWAVYADMMVEEEQQKKKHKQTHEVTMDEVPSLNETFASSPNKTLDSHGNSTSLQDLHPRSSVVASPMFDGPLIHQQGGNVFSELQGRETAEQLRATDRAAMAQQFKRIPHNPAKGSFSFPESDSDSDDEEIANGDQENIPVWTQPPPAAPVPAHASLPVALSTNQSVPAYQRDEQALPPAPFSPPSQPVDEVERQRAKLMKHTPAKPSRLREVKYPSPSVKSDAGNESFFVPTPAQAANSSIPTATPAAEFDFGEMPDAEPLVFDDPELEARFRAYVASDEYKAYKDTVYNGDFILTYDSSDEMSDD